MVEFSNPAALWLLTLIAPLILLYLLKRRRQDRIVSSLMLWKQALEDMRAHRPFQRLRSQLLLYLQILVLVLITAILAGPHLVQSAQESRRWVLVMDLSASMQATDEKPDRFHAARDRLLQELDRAPEADEVLLLTMGAEASVLQPFTATHGDVRRKLQQLEPEDTAGNWQQLARVLEPLMKDHPLPRLIIASDFAGFPEELRSKFPFEPIAVGSTGDNVAITRMVAEPILEDPGSQQLFYQIRNESQEPRTVDVELRAEGRVLDAYTAQVGPSAGIDRTAGLTVQAPTQITLRVKPDDALKLDNEFVLRVEPSARWKVHAAYRNPFLVKALAALPSVELAENAEIRIAETSITDQPLAGIYFITPQAEAPSGKIVQWSTSHPVMRFVDAGLWALARYTVLNPPPNATVLMETSRGPVAFAQQSDVGRKIVLGFRLEDSNLYQLAGLPVFLQNAVQWIEESLHKQLPTLTGPSIRKKGPFQDSAGSQGYANFADDAESRILPGHPAGLSNAGTHLLPRKRDISRWFLILAMSIVILEWWAFHRRMEL